MTVVVALDTLAVLFLALLVAALLRSHAEILKRLEAADRGASDRSGAARMDPSLAPVADGRSGARAIDIEGTTVDGEPATRALSTEKSGTLLAFLTSGCSTCGEFWRRFAAGTVVPGGADLLAVVKDSDHESPVKLRALAGGRVPMVMSSDAWEDYTVPVAPYFVFVHGGTIHSEGAASRWEQVESLLADAIAETPLGGPSLVRVDPRVGDGHPERIRAADQALEAAGIGPGDPRLYFGEEPPPGDLVVDG
jgi:hypothetical protein